MGMLSTVLGAASGGLMLRITPEQAEALHTNQSIRVAGGHTVGGSDGGPGIAGVGWSTEHGDLRIPHFFGLHGLQIIPLFGWLVLRGSHVRRRRSQASIAFAAAASYLGFIGILTWQALRGQSIVAPDTATLYALGVWLAATAVAGFTLLRGAVWREYYSTASRTTL
jgi:hypothetical protein